MKKRQTVRDIKHKLRKALADAEAAGYLTAIPKAIPPGVVLVHNHVRPTRRIGSRGFRAWLQAPDPDRLDRCGCDWASELGSHYRVRRA